MRVTGLWATLRQYFRSVLNYLPNDMRSEFSLPWLRMVGWPVAAIAITVCSASVVRAQDIPAASVIYAAASEANVSLNITSVYDSNSAETSPALAYCAW